jgi:hypothetical protein
LRWDVVDLEAAVLTLRRSVHVHEDGQVVEKDTKTHQQRRVALDVETIEACGPADSGRIHRHRRATDPVRRPSGGWTNDDGGGR